MSEILIVGKRSSVYKRTTFVNDELISFVIYKTKNRILDGV